MSVFPTGVYEYSWKNATSIRIGDKIIVDVPGWPTQTTDKIEFIDKPLIITQTIPKNVWGAVLSPDFKYKISIAGSSN